MKVRVESSWMEVGGNVFDSLDEAIRFWIYLFKGAKRWMGKPEIDMIDFGSFMMKPEDGRIEVVARWTNGIGFELIVDGFKGRDEYELAKRQIEAVIQN